MELGVLSNQCSARFEQTLPKGIILSNYIPFPTTNGIKHTIMLEELKEMGVDAGYDAIDQDW